MKLRPANEKDLERILTWFQSKAETQKWGGPSMHFPIDLKQFKIDLDWEVADSYSLVNEN